LFWNKIKIRHRNEKSPLIAYNVIAIRYCVHCNGRRLDTYFIREGMKRKNELADLQKITRKEYTLDWSQYKVFLVNYDVISEIRIL